MSQLSRMTVVALLALTWGLSACGGDETCSSSDECFAGEVCNQGRCEAPAPENSTTSDGGMSTTDGATNNGNNGGPNGTPNSSMGTDAGLADTGGADDMSSGGDSCIVSPFDVSCESDGNDDFGDYVSSMTKGCVTDDENFQAMDETVSALLCALEQADRYTQLYGECDEKSFITEVRLTPKVPCDPDDILFSVSMQGKSCANQDESPDITCSVQEDGSMLAQIVVRPSGVPSIGSMSIRVEPARENVHFEYDLNVVMR